MVVIHHTHTHKTTGAIITYSSSSGWADWRVVRHTAHVLDEYIVCPAFVWIGDSTVGCKAETEDEWPFGNSPLPTASVTTGMRHVAGIGRQKKKIAYGVGGWWLAAVAAAGVLASVQSFLRSNVIGRTSRMWARVSRFQPLQAFQLPAWPRSSSSSRFFRTHKGLQRRRFGWIVREQWGQRAVFVSALRRRWRNYDAIRLFPTRDAKLFLQKLNDQRASCHFVLLLIPFSPIRKTRANWTGRQSEMGGTFLLLAAFSLSLSLWLWLSLVGALLSSRTGGEYSIICRDIIHAAADTAAPV